ncbi:MAG: patatin-like phospholipase family protein [Verrucomicrobia bacterium]|nr:patatin-like phospholipase family protein [Verrucomicrobiota bacterium]
MNGSGLALCLGSSFRGYYAHCGFLAEISHCPTQPAKIVGASAGAIASLLYAGGWRGEELLQFITASGLTRSFFDWGFLLRIPGVLTHLRGTGIFTGNGAITYLRKHLGPMRLEDLREPQLGIAVTDLLGGQALLVSHGDAIEYAVASCMVPGLFRARAIDGRLLWDGGLAHDLPFQRFIEDPDIHTIVLHRVEHTRRNPSASSGAWNMTRGISATHAIIANELNARRKELVAMKGKRIIEYVTVTPHPGLTHKHQHRLIDAGRHTGRQAAKELTCV